LHINSLGSSIAEKLMTDLAARDAAPYDPIGLVVLTGFLGAGKTTLLNRLLRSPALDRSVVLVNEIGEIGIDHLIVREFKENVVLLETGCLCCAVRDDMVHALRELFVQRLRGEIPGFDRVVLETTGLADPVPIIHTLMSDPMLTERFRMLGLFTVVDASLGESQIERHEEALRQVVVADRLVLTKRDIAEPGREERLRARLAALNPGAAIIPADETRPEAILHADGYDPDARPAALRRWLGAVAATPYRLAAPRSRPISPAVHAGGVDTYGFEAEEPLDWGRLSEWLGALVADDGASILRMKGILHIEGHARPVVVNGVQHVFYPPIELRAWPGEDRRSQLVFILRNPERALVETLEKFALGQLAAARAPAALAS
jgi:G3E family GTPase